MLPLNNILVVERETMPFPSCYIITYPSSKDQQMKTYLYFFIMYLKRDVKQDLRPQTQTVTQDRIS